MSGDKETEAEPEKAKSEVEILATALADSSKEASSSSKNTVRVLGVLLAFSVLGNIALAGLNISGKFLGTDIQMGNPEATDDFYMDDEAFLRDAEDYPTVEWCDKALAADELLPEDNELCFGLYPFLFE